LGSRGLPGKAYRTWNQVHLKQANGTKNIVELYNTDYTDTMPLSIKSPEAEELVRKLASATGESLTAAIVTALRERLDRLERQRAPFSLVEQLDEIARRAASLPVLDQRTPEEIIGYDENGIPR
jgi:antitoxin VapB